MLEQVRPRRESASLAMEMLAETPGGRLKTLLAQLLEFHWREARPMFWARFDRAEKISTCRSGPSSARPHG